MCLFKYTDSEEKHEIDDDEYDKDYEDNTLNNQIEYQDKLTMNKRAAAPSRFRNGKTILKRPQIPFRIGGLVKPHRMIILE